MELSPNTEATNGNVISKLKIKFQQFIYGRGTRKEPVTSVIETDFLQQGDGQTNKAFQGTLDNHVMDRINSNLGSYGTFEEDIDENKCDDIASQLEQQLRCAKEYKLHSDLHLPKDLVQRIARDVVVMSQCEPCGLSGCVLYVNLEKKKTCIQLGKLTFDPDTLATFELRLTLIEDTKKWLSLWDLVRPLFVPCLGGLTGQPIVISKGFQVVKTKLYKVT